jgi:alpha-galactosidase
MIGDKSIDPSNPDVLAKVHDDIFRLHQWGYKLIKHDFTTFEVTGLWGFEMTDGMGSKGRTFADKTRTTAEILLDLYRTIRNAAGSSLVIGCNTVSHLSAGLFEIQRIGDDTSGKEWSRTVKMGVNTLAFRGVQQGAFYEADADCVGLTTDIAWEHNRQWLDLVARSGTPLFVSAQAEAVGSEQNKAMKKAFELAAVRQPTGEALDWMETRTPRKWRLMGEITEFDWG